MILQGPTNDFKLAILEGVHAPTDTYMIALYTQDADLTELTSAYTTRGEVEAPGYRAGGQALTQRVAMLDGAVAVLSWGHVVWERATMAARAALVYNLSKNNRAVAVIDLGRVVTSTNAPFVVELPPPTAQDALIRIG